MSNNNIQSETENYKAQRKIQTSQHQAILALERNRYQQWVGRIETEHLRNITFMEGEHQRYIDFSITHHRQSMANLTTHHRKYLSDVSILYEQHTGNFTAQHQQQIANIRAQNQEGQEEEIARLETSYKKAMDSWEEEQKTAIKDENDVYKLDFAILGTHDEESVTKLIKEFETEVLDHEEANKERIERVEEGGREYISDLEKRYQLDMAKLEKAQMESMGHH